MNDVANHQVTTGRNLNFDAEPGENCLIVTDLLNPVDRPCTMSFPVCCGHEPGLMISLTAPAPLACGTSAILTGAVSTFWSSRKSSPSPSLHSFCFAPS